MKSFRHILILIFIVGLSSCRYYKGHIMFQTENSIIVDSLAIVSVHENYKIQPGDRFEITVSSNNGELIIDPDNLIKQELELLMNQVRQKPIEYVVLEDGAAKLPIVGHQKIAGMTVNEANVFLAESFGQQYPNSFVNITMLNKRVVVFGPSGGQVIPLENENMSVLEVLAISQQITERAYADNIRLIRGNLSNPNVLVIDLTTIEGMKSANLALKPNDIIYVQPKQALAGQALRENVLPYVTVLTSITQAVLLYLTLKQ